MASTSTAVDWKALDIEARQVDPTTLRRREKNAHYMPPAMFKRLVENVRIDGRLTTTVLVCQDKDGSLEILSGHHRTAAAIEAGLPLIDALVITTPLTEKRKVAIQLSHNSINGDDDKSLLADLYASLDIDAKKFSGLDDSVLDMGKGITAGALGGANIKYDELLFSFLPEDRAAFEIEMEAIAKRAKKCASTPRRTPSSTSFSMRSCAPSRISTSSIPASRSQPWPHLPLNGSISSKPSGRKRRHDHYSVRHRRSDGARLRP